MNNIAKTPEQLTYDTKTLFKQLDKQDENIKAIQLQLVGLETHVKSLTSLVEKSLSNSVPAAQCEIKHNTLEARINDLEHGRESCVTYKEYSNLCQSHKALKKTLWAIAFIFLVPLATIVMYNLFSGPTPLDIDFSDLINGGN